MECDYWRGRVRVGQAYGHKPLEVEDLLELRLGPGATAVPVRYPRMGAAMAMRRSLEHLQGS